MSDEEIRNLLDLGVEDLEFGPPIEATDTWAAGRRTRTRRSWGVGLGAVAAAAAVVGVVWTQGLGGDVAPQPPADGTLTEPTLLGTPTETDSTAETDAVPGDRGEPFFAQFEQAGSEAPFQLSGASEPATLEDLQGTWQGPHGETFALNDTTLTVDTGPPCHEGGSHTVELTTDGRLVLLDTEGWEVMDCSADEEGRTDWRSALRQEPLLSLDGETLLISGLDGAAEETRVPASLTVGAADEAGFIWEDRPSQTGVTPVGLGADFQLMVSGDAEDLALTSISDLNLESPGLCGQVMVSSLRSDGVLLAGAPAPWPVCTEGEDALPPAEPSPAVVALLQSGPTVSFDDGTMVIAGTIPESLLGQSTAPPDDTTATSEPPEEEGSEDPPSGPEMIGTPVVVVLSEGAWAPAGELTPLTGDEAVDRRWQLVDFNRESPRVNSPELDYGLTLDDSGLRVRSCGVDVTIAGTVQNGLFSAAGEPDIVADPDPSADCSVPTPSHEWAQILTNEPRLSTDGEILVIAGGVGDVQLESVGMALLSDTVTDARGGPTRPVTVDDLSAGLMEVPGPVAAQEVGVPGVRDLQPEQTARLSWDDGVVSVDVGCADPLSGPAWFSQVGPHDAPWQLTAVLPAEPDCQGAAADDAELWRQMLAHGTFLHHFGDYVVLDAWADPSLSAPGD